jgi:hypothetical protein
MWQVFSAATYDGLTRDQFEFTFNDSETLLDFVPVSPRLELSVTASRRLPCLFGSSRITIFPLRGSVQDLKQRIEAKESIPVADQRLLFCGRELADDLAIAVLEYCNPDFPIRLVVRSAEAIPLAVTPVDCRRSKQSSWIVWHWGTLPARISYITSPFSGIPWHI